MLGEWLDALLEEGPCSMCHLNSSAQLSYTNFRPFLAVMVFRQQSPFVAARSRVWLPTKNGASSGRLDLRLKRVTLMNPLTRAVIAIESYLLLAAEKKREVSGDRAIA